MKSIAFILACLLFVAPLSWGKGRYVVSQKQRNDTLVFAKAVLDPHIANELEIKKLDNPFSVQRARLKK